MTLMQSIPGPARSIAPQTPQRIAIVTDAWHPQMNGVVRTLTTTCEQLREDGHEVMVVSPDQFASIPCPTYPEIRLAFTRPGLSPVFCDPSRPRPSISPPRGRSA